MEVGNSKLTDGFSTPLPILEEVDSYGLAALQFDVAVAVFDDFGASSNSFELVY